MNEFTKSAYSLFARPTAIEGVARLFDVAGNLQVYKTSKTGEEADRNATASDWQAVGSDLLAGMREYES